MNDEVPPEELQPHPKNAEIYGDPDPSERFIEDVRENGVENPIAVVEDSHFTGDDEDMPVVLDGHRRRYAADATGHEVPIGERRTFETSAEELADLIRHNDYREKTFSQRMGEADAIREVEERAAQDRMTEGGEGSVQMNRGSTRDKIADRVGLGSGSTYRKARKVWDAAQDGHPTAEVLVEQLDSGEESIHGAYTTLRAIREFSTTDTVNALLDNLVTEGQLSEEAVRQLKATNPGTVLGWLSAEHDIMPVAEGSIPDDVQFIETGTAPIENIDASISDGIEGTDTDIVWKRAGMFTLLIQRGYIHPYISIAPAEDGTFAFLSGPYRTILKAYEMSPLEKAHVTVCNIDGTDTAAVEHAVKVAVEQHDLETDERGGTMGLDFGTYLGDVVGGFLTDGDDEAARAVWDAFTKPDVEDGEMA